MKLRDFIGVRLVSDDIGGINLCNKDGWPIEEIKEDQLKLTPTVMTYLDCEVDHICSHYGLYICIDTSKAKNYLE